MTATTRLVERSSTADGLLAVRCSGRKRDLRPCNNLLAEIRLSLGSVVRVKCKDCNTVNTFEGRTIG